MNADFDWSEEENRQLIEIWGISIERIISAIEQGCPVEALQHSSQQRYPGLSIYAVDIDGYTYLVPIVLQDGGRRFLKTIIPTRKAARDHRRKNQQ